MQTNAVQSSGSVSTATLNEYANELYLVSDQVGMTVWEKDFLFDMVSMKSYSRRQAEIILQLVDKYE
jgi:hypothetical protein